MKEGVKGEYLFGEFGIADAFFWPVLWVRPSPPLPSTDGM